MRRAASSEGRRAAPSDLPIAQRVAALEGDDGAGRRTWTGGNNELVFDPSSRSQRGDTARDGGIFEVEGLTTRARLQDVRQFVAVAARIIFARTLQCTDLFDDVLHNLTNSQ